MSTQVATKDQTLERLDGRILSRILEEGYGKGAWHGPDMKAALADVTEELAFRRPAPERHSIAEIALHHTYYVRSVRARLLGKKPERFVMEGEDWFTLPGKPALSFSGIAKLLADEQRLLAETAAKAEVTDASLELVLGITCHAVYHAGQVQLVKKLLGA